MFVKTAGEGVELACTTGSAEIAIPNDYAGKRARYLMIANDSLTLAIHFRVGQTGGTSVTTDTVVPLNGVPIYVCVIGNTHIQAIMGSGTANLSMSAVEPR